MTAPESTDALQERANELYWNSPDTVDQVAEQAGMSRNALYGVVRPLDAGADCAACGEGLVFPNRSTRAAGRALCLACGSTASVDELSGATAAAGAASRHSAHEEEETGSARGWSATAGDYTGRLRRWREDVASVEPQRAVMIGGAAALGILVGAAATSALRRMV